MFILVIILIIALAMAIFVAAFYRFDRNQQVDAYIALEKGSLEIADGYEQEYLSHAETIQAQAATIKRLHEDLSTLHHVAEHHSDNCIPEYAPILGQEEYIALSQYSDDPEKYVDKIMEYIGG